MRLPNYFDSVTVPVEHKSNKSGAARCGKHLYKHVSLVALGGWGCHLCTCETYLGWLHLYSCRSIFCLFPLDPCVLPICFTYSYWLLLLCCCISQRSHGLEPISVTLGTLLGGIFELSYFSSFWMLPPLQVPTAVMRQLGVVYREFFRFLSVVNSLFPIEMIALVLHCSSRGGMLVFGQWWVVELGTREMGM